MAKILVVEDSKFQMKQIIKTLEALGYETIYASNGKEGLEKVKSENPDLVMTDLLMPELDGIGFIKQLKEDAFDKPIVVLSADVQKPVREECISLGVTEFLNKPLDKDLVKEKLTAIVNPWVSSPQTNLNYLMSVATL